jgi:D-glycero-D-manno-heptose 1,7-bisphosphate phosphatase
MRINRKKLEIDQAVILCGGLGTRLGQLTKKTPKPLLRFLKRPFLNYILKNLSRYGIKEILLLCYYKKKQFIKKYHNKKIYNLKIKCVIEKKPLGTFGSLKNSSKYLKQYFLLLNGDTFFDINLRDFIFRFDSNSFIGTLAVAKKKENRFSKVLIRKNYISKFNVKKSFSSFINSGTYIFSKKICNIKSKKFSSLENDILPKLVEKKKIQALKYLKSYNNFIDIGIPSDYKKVEKFLIRAFSKPAIFLDRDGVINEDLHYVHKVKDFIWKNNVKKAIKFLNDRNFYVFVVTNQSGVGRGYYKEKDVIKLHKWINQELRYQGSQIDDFFYATYHSESKFQFSNQEKKLRKPNIGMIKMARKKWLIINKKSLVIGDQIIDIKMAKKACLKSILIKKNDDLFDVVKQYYNE